ncbi:alkane hydroxylase MAH1-like [Papaver somniferum]|uniref:alkane hydroxylase MAH1-like n=1 Tax=Papaver somniferum TaxID=3469 RepID=UPI000E6F748B|nr:alkane hydroxylase MAH1-like [Papaver somniferum]
MHYISPILSSMQLFLKKWPEFYLAFICLFSITWYFKLKNQPIVHWPILDILPSLLLNYHHINEWTVDISKVFGGTRVEKGPFFSPLNVLLTCDPQNIEYMVKTNFSNYPKGSEYKKTFDVLGDGLFNIDFHSWHIQRRMARLTFASKKARDIIAKMTQKVVQDSLLPLLEYVARQSSIVDLEDMFMRYTFDTSVSIIFGTNPNYLAPDFPRNDFANAMEDASEAVFYRHVVPSLWKKLCHWLMVGNERKMKNAWRTMDRHLAQYISAQREDRVKETEETNLLQVYMSNKEEGNNEQLLADEDKFLRDTSLTLMFAGRDTTGTALTWFLYMVSKNPRVEAKILEELKLIYSVKDKEGEEDDLRSEKGLKLFDAQDIKKMVYLQAALYECLRLYPSLPLNRKGALKDDVLPDGTVVKQGMMIIFSTYAMGRMEWVWGKDCLEFKPERWLDMDGGRNLESMSKFFTFSIGPRTCLGKDMAFMIIKSAASAMLFNFKIEVLKGQNVEPKPSLTLKTKNGLKVMIKRRIL